MMQAAVSTPDAAAIAARLDDEASALVATLPDLPPARLDAMIADAGALAAAPVATEAVALASTIARLVASYREGRAVLEGWALVASAAHTLARAIAAPGPGHGAALAAARFELETLLPREGAPPPAVAAPDVPLASLRRRT